MKNLLFICILSQLSMSCKVDLFTEKSKAMSFLSKRVAWQVNERTNSNTVQFELVRDELRMNSTFKERLHDLCRGESSADMTQEEENLYLNQVMQHFNEVYSLIGNANEDRYLFILTQLVRMSNLSFKQKKIFYRESYKKCLEKLAEGEEWTDTILIFVNGKFLTKNELKTHLNSINNELKAACQKAINAGFYAKEPAVGLIKKLVLIDSDSGKKARTRVVKYGALIALSLCIVFFLKSKKAKS